MSGRRRIPAPATAVAVIALVFAMGGAAIAAKQFGPKRIKPGAITKTKIRDGAVATAKLADNAVTASKIAANAVGTSELANGAVGTDDIANGAVGTDDIADGVVSAAKLTQTERSEVFTLTANASKTFPAATDTTVLQTTIPVEGSFVVTASLELGSNAANPNFISCELLDANNPIASGVVKSADAQAIFFDTLTLVGISDGGVVRVSCNPDIASSARDRTLIATRAGAVTALTDATP
jgi:hypothetical protein